MSFPAEAVPDGSILAPHHYQYALLAVLFLTAYGWDRFTDREPWALALGSLIGLWAFTQVWPFYPLIGALMAFLGPLIASVALIRWRAYHERPVFWLAIGFLLLAWDDWLSHAFGVWTPADALFHALL